MAQHVNAAAGGRPAPRQSPEARRWAWAEVSLGAISHNLREVRRRVGPSRRALAVVKANAYGHGAVRVARRLETDGVDLLGVAFPEEGVELRDAGIRAPILVLGASAPDQLPEMRARALVPSVYSFPFLEAILSEPPGPDSPGPFHLKVDTGMGRLGLPIDALGPALARLSARKDRVRLDGLFTTLSCSDDPLDPHTGAQLAAFGEALARIRDAGFSPAYVHAANSGGVIDHPPSWLDTVRPGIMMYGIHPSERSTRLDLRPALSFKGRIALVKKVPAGTPIGYGREFVTARDSVIGTVPAGYADGLSRRIAAAGHTLVRGRRAPYAGRISMDHCMLDLTDVPGAADGDEVVMIGTQGAEALSAEQVARWIGTIAYEVLSRIGPRLARIYDEDGGPQEML